MNDELYHPYYPDVTNDYQRRLMLLARMLQINPRILLCSKEAGELREALLKGWPPLNAQKV